MEQEWLEVAAAPLKHELWHEEINAAINLLVSMRDRQAAIDLLHGSVSDDVRATVEAAVDAGMSQVLTLLVRLDRRRERI